MLLIVAVPITQYFSLLFPNFERGRGVCEQLFDKFSSYCCHTFYSFQLSCHENKCITFYLFYSFTAVHKTEVIKNTLDPVWREMVVSVGTLCNGDKARTLKVECYDWDSDGRFVILYVLLPKEITFFDLFLKL